MPVPSARFWLCLVGPNGLKAQLSILGCTRRQEQPLQLWPEEREVCRRHTPMLYLKLAVSSCQSAHFPQLVSKIEALSHGRDGLFPGKAPG